MLNRARQAGLVRILDPGIDLATSRAAVILAEEIQEIYAAIGVHPNEANSWNESSLEELTKLVDNPKVVAIGEIGLDYYHEDATPALQRSIFIKQLEFAREVNLPVIIHTRNQSVQDIRAIVDTLKILKEWKNSLVQNKSDLASYPGVLHSFSGDETIAEQALDLNLFIGVDGPVTFKNSPILQRVATIVPLEHLLLETDAPFLTPHPFRGRRNEPAHVRFVAEIIAQLRNLPVEVVADITTSNSERLFHWQVIKSL